MSRKAVFALILSLTAGAAFGGHYDFAVVNGRVQPRLQFYSNNADCPIEARFGRQPQVFLEAARKTARGYAPSQAELLQLQRYYDQPHLLTQSQRRPQSLRRTTSPQSRQNYSVKAKTLSPLTASQNKKGDKFTLLVLEPQQFKNAVIQGRVAKAKAAGKVKGKSELQFAFDQLVLANGSVVPIVADLTGVVNSQGIKGVDEEGRVIGKSSRAKNAAITALLSGIGAAIGGVAAGKSGAARGAAIGAAAGLTISFSTRGQDIRFESGSVFELSMTIKTGR